LDSNNQSKVATQNTLHRPQPKYTINQKFQPQPKYARINQSKIPTSASQNIQSIKNSNLSQNMLGWKG